MSTNPLSDPEIRGALQRVASPGLAALVADAVAREVTTTRQDGRLGVIGAWLRPADGGLGGGVRPVRPALLMATFAALLAAAVVTGILVGGLLRQPAPLRNGSIAVAPPEGGVVVVGDGGSVAGGERGTALAWSPGGERLAWWSAGAADPASLGQAHAWRLVVMDARTRSVDWPVIDGLPGTLEPNGRLEWSADGRRLLAPVLADGSPTVLILDPASGRATRLGAPDTDTAIAAWSPDGRHLATLAERRFTNNWHLDLADADGADASPVPLSLPPGMRLSGAGAQGGMAMQMAFPIDWSPDGRRLLVIASREAGGTRAFAIDVGDGSVLPATPPSANPIVARWSPDGGSIAFVSFDPGRAIGDLYVVDVDGADLRHVAVDACELLEWAPDGSELLFDTGLCTGAAVVEVRSVRPDGSGARTLWSGPRPVGLQPLLPTSASVDGSEGVSASWQGLRP